VVTSNVISYGGIEASGIVASPAYQSVGFLFANNTIKNNGQNGILFEGGQGRIEDNIISHNGTAGVHLSDGSRTYINGNYVADNTTYGIYFANSNGHAYRDNFLRGNKTGALGGETNTDAGGNIE
jgi:parallel beta-helix repeat protein